MQVGKQNIEIGLWGKYLKKKYKDKYSIILLKI